MMLAVVTLKGDPGPGAPGPVTVSGAAILFLLGGGCVHLLMRYGLARLVLDDDGFSLVGPLRREAAVAWNQVTAWERLGTIVGPPALRILHDGRRRLSIPLIYEDAHLLELGLVQRRFPRA
jgi:hypothetical protein